MVDRQQLFIEVARLYYLEELTQAEIGVRLNMTRSNVSKILKSARRAGVVEIHIRGAPTPTLGKELRLKERFHLKDAVVVASEGTYEETLLSVGRRSARYLESLLRDGIRIGVSWGTSLYRMVEELRAQTLRDAIVVQLHGGLGSKNLSIDGYELATRLSHKIGARTYLMQTPLIVGSQELRELLVKEPDIAESLAMGETVDVAVLGIGTNTPEHSALVRAGLVSKEASADLRKSGAIGMICGHYFGADGNLLDLPVNKTVISVTLDKLRELPLRVAIALGERKVDALRGAILGGYVNAVITDEVAATGLLEDPADDDG